MTKGLCGLRVRAMGNKKLLSILGALLLAGAVYAQTKTAFVDSEKILGEYEDAKLARATLDQAILQWRNELDSMRRANEKAEAEFKAQQPMLSEEALRARQQELAKMRKSYDDFAQDIWGENGKVSKKHGELFTPILDKMNKVIEQLAAEKGIGLVLDLSAGGILYADANMDITSDVITELNREYVAVSASFKKRVAVLSVFPDSRSQAAGLASEVRGMMLKTVISSLGNTDLNFEQVGESEIQTVLQSYGATFESAVDDTNALRIGLSLNADLVMKANVTTEAGQISVIIDSYLPKEGRKIIQLGDLVAEKDKNLYLEQKVRTMVAQILSSSVSSETKQP